MAFSVSTSTRKSPDPPVRPSARLRSARAVLRIAFQIVRPKHTYEPVEIGGRHYAQKRDADIRWGAIAATIRQYGAENLLDIGCAEGWFLRRAAEEFGCFGLGVEGGDRRVLIGEIARLHDGVERVAVMKGTLGPDDIRRLPACDLVLCLSVVHHVIRHGGLEAAREFLRAAASRARKAMLFEMGTSEEKQLSWTGVLPGMPEGQERFVSELLTSAGLTNIRVVASTPGLRGDAPRLVFAAEPG